MMHPRRVCVLLACIPTLKEAAFSVKQDSTKALLTSLSARRVQKGALPTLVGQLPWIRVLASALRLRNVRVTHLPFVCVRLVHRLAALYALIVE